MIHIAPATMRSESPRDAPLPLDVRVRNPMKMLVTRSAPRAAYESSDHPGGRTSGTVTSCAEILLGLGWGGQREWIGLCWCAVTGFRRCRRVGRVR